MYIHKCFSHRIWFKNVVLAGLTCFIIICGITGKGDAAPEIELNLVVAGLDRPVASFQLQLNDFSLSFQGNSIIEFSLSLLSSKKYRTYWVFKKGDFEGLLPPFSKGGLRGIYKIANQIPNSWLFAPIRSREILKGYNHTKFNQWPMVLDLWGWAG